MTLGKEQEQPAHGNVAGFFVSIVSRGTLRSVKVFKAEMITQVGVCLSFSFRFVDPFSVHFARLDATETLSLHVVSVAVHEHRENHCTDHVIPP